MQSTLTRLNTLLMQRNMLLASLLAVILCSLVFQYLKARLGTMMLDEIDGYDRDTLVEHLLLYGDAGRRLHFWVTLCVDMVFPLAYGAFFGGLLARLARGTFVPLSFLALVPLLVLDWLENIQFLVIFAQFPTLGDTQIALASATTWTKFWCIRLALLWLLALVVARVWRKFYR